MASYRVVDFFVSEIDGVTVKHRPGEIVSDDTDVFKRYRDKFEPVEDERQRPEVEQATAAPAEQRGETRIQGVSAQAKGKGE